MIKRTTHLNGDCVTQMHYARKGIITPEMTYVAERESLEAEVIRGAPSTHLALWADWRMMQAARVESWVAVTAAGGVPFAVLAVANSGQAGVAEAALLARDHRAFRRPLAALAAMMLSRRLVGSWASSMASVSAARRPSFCHWANNSL